MERAIGSRIALATAVDVAHAAGVSQATVSRAFTPGSSISEATRDRIFRIAEQLGYQPNLIARSLTSGRSNLVGIGIENLRNPFFSETLEAMSLELAKAGLRSMLFTTRDDETADTPVQDVLRYRLDALVLVSATFSSGFASQCQAARVPVILYNRTNGDERISSVTGDNVFGARALAAFLIAGGHRRFAFIAGLEDSSTSRARESGFNAYLSEHGFAAPLRATGDFTYEGAAAATRRLLLSPDRPDAIFCANDHMATAAIDIAQFEFGLEVGRELSIVGFDDIQAASRPCYSLTTFAQRADLMVRATIDIIRGLRANDAPAAPVHRIINGELVIRTSARRPTRSAITASTT
ncbi:hypothetical protein ASG11_05535 [Sphingomonas sp. Leaf357]|nr:hypothetical protein ASG11_05535 [Sphingomonas sp. Leaf357]